MKYQVTNKTKLSLVGWTCLILFLIFEAGFIILNFIDEPDWKFVIIASVIWGVFIGLSAFLIYLGNRPLIIVEGHSITIYEAFKKKRTIQKHHINGRRVSSYDDASDNLSSAVAAGTGGLLGYLLGTIFAHYAEVEKTKASQKITYLFDDEELFCVMFITQRRKIIDFHATNSLIFTKVTKGTVYGKCQTVPFEFAEQNQGCNPSHPIAIFSLATLKLMA